MTSVILDAPSDLPYEEVLEEAINEGYNVYPEGGFKLSYEGRTFFYNESNEGMYFYYFYLEGCNPIIVKNLVYKGKF